MSKLYLGSTLIIDTADIDAMSAKVDTAVEKLSSVYEYKGSLSTYSDLEALDTSDSTIVQKGFVYNVEETGMNYAWNGASWDALGGDVIDRFDTTTPDSTNVAYNVGGIGTGMTAGQLKGQTLSNIVDMMLFPTLQPTITPSDAPRVAITAKSADVSLRYVGSGRPTTSDFNVAPIRGSLTYGTINGDRNYAGPAGTPTITIPTSDVTSNGGTMTITASIVFGAGAKPKDSKGGEATVPAYPGGTVTGSTTINYTKPYYVTTGANSALVEQAKLAWNPTLGSMVTPELTFTPCVAGTTPAVFKLPRAIYDNGKGYIEEFNTVAQKWETIPEATFNSIWAHTTATENISGIDVTYHIYTSNETKGSMKRKIHF